MISNTPSGVYEVIILDLLRDVELGPDVGPDVVVDIRHIISMRTDASLGMKNMNI